MAAGPRLEHRDDVAPPVELALEGMTCASCAARIEKRLNKLDGVSATVNFATQRAYVDRGSTRISVDDLIDAVASIGYHATPIDEATPRDSSRGDLVRLGTATALAAVLVLFTYVPASRVPGWTGISLVLATVAVFYAGWPFHRASVLNARHGVATMDTLVSVATLAAWTWSSVVVLAGLDQALYFDEAATITALILLGRYLESRATYRASDAIRHLLALGAKDANVLRDGVEVRVPVGELVVGDHFVVRPGEQIATDGVVVAGTSAVDASLLTGESLPVDVGPGDAVAGATLSTSGRLEVVATRVGADTALARIGRLVAQAQAGQAPIQRLADRVSAVFVPLVLGVAVLTYVGWFLTGHGVTRSFAVAVAVVVIACPCALGLATPTALIVGTGRGAQLGILIKGPSVLERTRRISTIVLDKTGTITEGRMAVVGVAAAPGIEADAVLRLAATAEEGSEHPIGRAIVHAVRERGEVVTPADAFVARVSAGVTALIDGHRVVVARANDLLDDASPLAAQRRTWEDTGATVVAVSRDGDPYGLLALADRVKPTSRAAVDALRSLGLTVVLLSGDHERAARAVAREVGIDRVIADVSASDKEAVIAQLQRDGAVVAMVGDGVNDAPALARADLGIAIGTGTDVAMEAADVTLLAGDLRGAVDAITLARRTLTTIKGNLVWAFGYNVAAVPLAVAGVINPIVAAAAMACSSVFVVTNSLRLRRFQSSEREAARPA